MLRTRALVVTLALAILLAPLAAQAQQPKQVSRLGFLDASSPSTRAHLWEGLRQRLRELGYVEGKNIAIESRWAHGKADQLHSHPG